MLHDVLRWFFMRFFYSSNLILFLGCRSTSLWVKESRSRIFSLSKNKDMINTFHTNVGSTFTRLIFSFMVMNLRVCSLKLIKCTLRKRDERSSTACENERNKKNLSCLSFCCEEQSVSQNRSQNGPQGKLEVGAKHRMQLRLLLIDLRQIHYGVALISWYTNPHSPEPIPVDRTTTCNCSCSHGHVPQFFTETNPFSKKPISDTRATASCIACSSPQQLLCGDLLRGIHVYAEWHKGQERHLGLINQFPGLFLH